MPWILEKSLATGNATALHVPGASTSMLPTVLCVVCVELEGRIED